MNWKRFTLGLLILFLLLTSSAFGELAKTGLWFGVVNQEGLIGRTPPNSYQLATFTIKYLNTYFEARGIDLRLYPRPQMGTYFETLDRLRKRKLDLAVLPSFIYLAAGEEVDFKLVGILDYPRSWRSLIIVPKDSAISNMRDLARDAGKLKIVYVNELSASGYIIPKIYFSDMKINFQEEIFSEGHLTSLEKMRAGEYGKEAALAVDEVEFDRFRRTNPEKAAWFKEIYAIENPMILKDCIFVSANASAENLRQLKEAFDPRSRAKVKDPKARGELERLYREISGAIGFKNIVTDVGESVFDYNNKYLARYNFNFTEHFSVGRVLEKIADDIDNRRLGDPGYRPKVAVVLSGGGASGSYQAGVLKALQEKLDEFNQQQRRGKPPLTIDLVAGTSLGAFNALLFSAGAIEEMNNFYNKIKAADVFSPNWRYQFMQTLFSNPFIVIYFINLLAYLLYLNLRKNYIIYDYRRLGMTRGNARVMVIGAILIGVILAGIILINQQIIPVMVLFVILINLGDFLIKTAVEFYDYASMMMQKQFNAAGLIWGLIKTSLLLGSFLLLVQFLVNNMVLESNERLFTYVFIILLLFYMLVKSLSFVSNLPIVLAVARSAFFMRVELISQFYYIVVILAIIIMSAHFFRSGMGFFDSSGLQSSYAQVLAKIEGVSPDLGEIIISQKFIESGIKKEFVITATDIKQMREVYFYYRPLSFPSTYLPSDIYWVPLRKYPEKLIEAAAAAASYMFVCTYNKMMIGKDELILLDGGMLHQVPVDAAISLGANYLIIVLSGEDTRAPSDPASWNLYQFTCNVNRISMFGSQAMDYLGREKAKSFLIAPREKKISQIDYNGAYYKGEFVTIEDYMQEGYRDAQGKGNGFREISAGEFVSK